MFQCKNMGHFVLSFTLCWNWEWIFSFLHLSCFAWYWLCIWSILKRNTSFEILWTSAFMWMYSFSFYVNFYVFYEHFTFLGGGSTACFCLLDKIFETFRTPIIFHQIQLPGAVLNAELLQLSETVLGFMIWWLFDGEITVWRWSAE